MSCRVFFDSLAGVEGYWIFTNSVPAPRGQELVLPNSVASHQSVHPSVVRLGGPDANGNLEVTMARVYAPDLINDFEHTKELLERILGTQLVDKLTEVELARQAYGLIKCEFPCQPPTPISKSEVDRLGELLRAATAAA